MSALDYVTLSTLTTVVMLIVFVVIVAWAYSGKRRAQFDAAARMPLDDEFMPPPDGTNGPA
jgi:cytochrome c oxidase cbb3-type subunit 4